MPIPPSYFDISGLPFSGTVPEADFNAGTFGGTVEEVWLRLITTVATDITIDITLTNGFIDIYDGLGVLVSTNPANAPFTESLGVDTYYIRIYMVPSAPVVGDLDIDVTSSSPPPAGPYIDITSLAFSVTIPQADFNAGTFSGGVPNEVWFRFVTAVDIILGIHCDSGGTFLPQSRVFFSDQTTLITRGDNRTLWVLLSPDTYFIQIRNFNGFGSSDFDFTVDFTQGPFATTIPAGAYVINDDSQISGTDPFTGEAYPATVWQTDGTFLGFARDVPAGEIGDALPSGKSLWHDRFGTAGTAGTLALLDTDLSILAAGIVVGAGLGGAFPNICHDLVQFYVLNQSDLGIYIVDDAGISSGPTATLVPGTYTAIGINRAGTILYHAHGTVDGIIGRWDLVTNSPLSDLYSIPGFGAGDYVGLTALNNHPGEILGLLDDSIVTYWYDSSANVYHLLHIASDGTLIDDIPYSGAGPTGEGIDHISYSLNDPTHIYLWLFTDGVLGNTGRFGELELATGTLTPFNDEDLFSAGVSLIAGGTIVFGPSASCSMVSLQLGGVVPPVLGEIIVIKVTNPTGDPTLFDITAGGGLTPLTYQLADGDSQTHSNVTPGSGYSIVETPNPLYTTSYNVSNGSSNLNISVAASETVIVTITNTIIPTPPPAGSGTGIYQLVPGKRNDTLWVTFVPQVTLDVKIP